MYRLSSQAKCNSLAHTLSTFRNRRAAAGR
jgi:hypothetical protein